MKRDARLQRLSADHHHALVLARRAVRAARGEGPSLPAAVWEEVGRRFARELEPHFGVEEEALLPALERAGEAELVARTRADHAMLRAMVEDHGASAEQRLAAFGERLEAHVRFEEHVLFPRAEAVLDGAALDAIGRAAARSTSGA